MGAQCPWPLVGRNNTVGTGRFRSALVWLVAAGLVGAAITPATAAPRQVLTCFGRSPTIVGSSEVNLLIGTTGEDVIVGREATTSSLVDKVMTGCAVAPVSTACSVAQGETGFTATVGTTTSMGSAEARSFEGAASGITASMGRSTWDAS